MGEKYMYFEFVTVWTSLDILRETTLDTAGNQGFLFSYVKSRNKNPINPARTYYCVNLKKSKFFKITFMNFTKITHYTSQMKVSKMSVYHILSLFLNQIQFL